MKRSRGQSRSITVAGVNSSDLLGEAGGANRLPNISYVYMSPDQTLIPLTPSNMSVEYVSRCYRPDARSTLLTDQQPALAKRDDVVAAPALIKIFPPPSRTFIGDLSDLGKVLAGLGITRSKDGRINPPGQIDGSWKKLSNSREGFPHRRGSTFRHTRRPCRRDRSYPDRMATRSSRLRAPMPPIQYSSSA